jgi:hypothetical protein
MFYIGWSLGSHLNIKHLREFIHSGWFAGFVRSLFPYRLIAIATVPSARMLQTKVGPRPKNDGIPSRLSIPNFQLLNVKM